MSRRHPYQRIAFITIVAACWVLGLFGLDRSRMSSFQLPIVVGAGLIGYWVVAAIRRRIDVGSDEGSLEVHEPQTCVFVTRLGELRSREDSSERAEVPERREIAAVEPRPHLPEEPVVRPVRRKPTRRNYIPLSG